MDKHHFIELLNKYVEGKATRAELQFILSYYNLFQAEPEVVTLMSVHQKKELKESIRQGIWRNIMDAEKMPVKTARVSMWKIGAGVAAAAAVLFFAFRLTLWNDLPVKPKSLANLSFIRNSNHVISLPDGSTVVLSSGSQLNYGPAFGVSDKREVYLDGQAFFDVRHDTSRPFVVHAGKVNVTVLGTAFNVKAISTEGDITVTVNRGRVRVSDPAKALGTITPRQQIIYNKQNQHAVQHVVDSENYLDWKKRDCLFDNLTITEVTGLLEDRFKVEIRVDGDVAKSERFTATFPQDQTLEQALNSICEFNGARYTFDKEKNIVIVRKK